jgi:hypothetical protein
VYLFVWIPCCGTFHLGLKSHSTKEHIDSVDGGSFFSLTIEEAQAIIENMASSQSWIDERTQTCTRKVHLLEVVDMLTAKIDTLMKKLEDLGLNGPKMVDSRMTCVECRETSHMGVNCPTVCQDVNFVGNSNGFHPHQGFNSEWNKPNFPFRNHQQGGNGQNFNRNELSLRDIIRDQVKINDDFSKRFQANDKLLESMNGKMDNFTIAIENQLSFNKMLETQIQQISRALPSQSNEIHSRDPVQESVKSITTIFEGQGPGSFEKSLGGD